MNETRASSEDALISSTSSSLTTTQVPTTTIDDYSSWFLDDDEESYDNDEDYGGLFGSDEDYTGESSKLSTSPETQKPLPIIFDEGIDLQTFNITKLTFTPQPWNAQDAFTSKVMGRLYLVFPGVIVGLLLGVSVWAILTLALRSLSAVKKKVMPKEASTQNPDETRGSNNCVEMGPVKARRETALEVLPYGERSIYADSTVEIHSETTSSGVGKSESDPVNSESSVSLEDEGSSDHREELRGS